MTLKKTSKNQTPKVISINPRRAGKTIAHKRQHVPALNPARLIVTLQQIAALDIPTEAKQVVSDILKTASNPRAESAETVIGTMDMDQQQQIREAMPEYAQVFSSSLARGRAELAALSEDEWNQAVRESNNE